MNDGDLYLASEYQLMFLIGARDQDHQVDVVDAEQLEQVST